jgi:hypothetical protein
MVRKEIKCVFGSKCDAIARVLFAPTTSAAKKGKRMSSCLGVKARKAMIDASRARSSPWLFAPTTSDKAKKEKRKNNN